MAFLRIQVRKVSSPGNERGQIKAEELERTQFRLFRLRFHGRLCRGSLSSVINNTSRRNFHNNFQLPKQPKKRTSVDQQFPVLLFIMPLTCGLILTKKFRKFDRNEKTYVFKRELLLNVVLNLSFLQRNNRDTQRQFSRPRIFGTFVLKFLAFLPLLGFPNI